MPNPLCIRWTIGNVSPAGFEALALSILGARKLFGANALYAIGVNTIPVEEAKRRAGALPDWLRWIEIKFEPAEFLAPSLDGGMAEGTGWKLIPPRLFPGMDELALDNDVILWRMPEALGCWLQGGRRGCVIAEDVAEGHGRFAALCGASPRNSGIRAIAASFDYADALRDVLADHPGPLSSELDEQGLQVAALSRGADPFVVTREEVSICSPFPPHQPELGRCGAHLVGLNAHDIPWKFYGRPAIEVRLEHWQKLRPRILERLGLRDANPTEALRQSG